MNAEDNSYLDIGAIRSMTRLAKKRGGLSEQDEGFLLSRVDNLESQLASLTEENESKQLELEAARGDAEYLAGQLASERARAEEAEGNTREFANKLAEVVGEREGLRQPLSEAEQRAARYEKVLRDIELGGTEGYAEYPEAGHLLAISNTARRALSPIDPPLAQGDAE
jgi:chromosome segregation ATPase